MKMLARYAACCAFCCLGCDPTTAPHDEHNHDAAYGQAVSDAGAVTLDASDAAQLLERDAALQSTTTLGEEVPFLSNVVMQALDEPGDRLRFAAVVVGLRTVEVLEEDEGELRARAVATFDPPELNRRRAPLSVWAIDVDCDQRLDLALSGLENEYVLRASASGEFGEREPWDRYFPPGVGSAPSDIRTQIGGNHVLIPFSRAKTLTVFVRPKDLCRWLAPIQIPAPAAPVGGAFAFGWPTGTDAVRLLLQTRGPEDDSVTVRVGPELAQVVPEGVVETLPTPPYVERFNSIASPYPLAATAGCPTRFLGSGQVSVTNLPAAAKRELTRLQIFSLQGQQYTWRDVAETSGLAAYGVIERPAQGELLIGAVRATTSGHEFVLLRQQGCSDPIVLARTPVDFSWRTPPAPLFGQLSNDDSLSPPGRVPRHLAPTLLVTKALSAPQAARILFAHYDGYDGRLIEARNDDDQWSLSFKQTTVHEERDDLSFPFTQSDVQDFHRDLGVLAP